MGAVNPSTFSFTSVDRPALRRFSKVVTFSTLFLIFAGGMVTSTGSGLAVPDWPLSYGTLFPPMIGGVFYEHGHRMIASVVGFLMLCMAVWMGFKEDRPWVRHLGFLALGAVILQGVLGGITVLFFLPPAVSTSHAVLAQSFFIMTIILAYSHSLERQRRESQVETYSPQLIRIIFCLIVLVYLQLIVGALMRHTQSGLAILDFPTMAGAFIPHFDQSMVNTINAQRFDLNLEPVALYQIVIHFIHRLGAFLILILVIWLNFIAASDKHPNSIVRKTVFILDLLVIVQITLGILTVLTYKAPVLTSFHVVTGAATLGFATLLFLRAAPVSLRTLKDIL